MLLSAADSVRTDTRALAHGCRCRVQYVRWAQRLNGTAAAHGACDPAGGPGRVPNVADAQWRAHGFEQLPYPGPGTSSWGDWQSVAGQFYKLPVAQALWRRHVRFMLTRVNRYTGIALTEDPTVMCARVALRHDS